ncbi:IclR family transcriptional regulator [Paraburkholderia sabiae]|uniref:IclR family transcriptional regulator n=1 Tax=Paraburkholderia sabiae TaxID=273251 RepID=A0ABU9QIA0_9BURK|nr:IclR family transcriptional regulator [Paraburkholderia sabiae]WJZ77500.1 IclR family transcriptional regulator [Paraburkholderia sabiae]CAD6558059.1 HTH-type transcriptional repressor AllR [Paraburkholderia sabiae]CAG9233002.1 Transcriptional regulator family protein 36 [Paraburkholderia sabiae]
MKPTDRALGIFEAFEAEGRPLTLSELAEAAGLPVSTSHGIVRVLLERGYLYLTSRRKDLFPTRRLYDMAAKIIANDPYLERIEPQLQTLRDATQETVIVGKRQHDEIVYLSVLEGPQTIRYSAAAGALKPLHSTSIGKAMLSRVDASELRRFLAQAALPSVTDNTLTTADELFDDIAHSREKGFFVTRGESVSDVFAIAVPVDVNRDVLGIAVAGPRHRMEEQIERIGAVLLEAKRSIETGGH